MDRLWAPWRYKYISQAQTDSNLGCVFCQKDDFVIFETEFCSVRLNKFPYNNGHLLIMPKRHIADISQLEEAEIVEIWKLIKFSKKLLDKLICPDGYNIGINLGRVAGAGIKDHLHFHLVPRWNGDTNFMPVISDTKVISQSLDEAKRLLTEGFKEFNYDRLEKNRGK